MDTNAGFIRLTSEQREEILTRLPEDISVELADNWEELVDLFYEAGWNNAFDKMIETLVK